jgi:fibronectin-binding autotransporter adhesin
LSHSGYATVNGGRTWATVSGGSIVGLAAYALNDFTTANVNVDITGNQTASGSSTPNSWRFNDTAGGSSVTIGAAAVVQLGGTSGIGGLLMTPDAAGDVLITGGTLRGFANGDVVLHQYNTNYVLQIASLLGNSTDANNQALTKAGPGTVYLANPAQQFTGPVRITGGTLRVDKLANAGSNSSIGRGGNVRMTVLTGGGRLLFTGSGNDSTDRGFLMEGDGVIDVSGSGTLTLGPQGSTAAVNSAVDVTSGLPNVDDVNDLTLQGSGAGVATGVIRLGTRPSEAASGVYIRPGGFLAGNLIKQGSGSWTLSGAESVCQLLEVREGTVVLNHPRNTLVDNANITISGGATLAMGTNTDKVGVVTLVSGSITGPGTLQGLRFDVQNGVINANLAGILTALTKTGGGTVALNGTCTYEQATVVQGGTLEGTGSLASAVTVQNGGTLGAGAGGLGAFTLGGLAIQAGGKLAIDVGAGGNTHDSFTVNGPVALGGELLVTSPDNATDKALPIITASGAITGTLAAPPRYSVSVVGNTVYLNLPAPTGTVLLVR